MNLSHILDGATMIRNYRTSSKPRKHGAITRLWLEKPVLRAGRFVAGAGIIVQTCADHVHIRAAMKIEVASHIVHHKKGEPILDLANTDIDKVLGIGVKIDIVVKPGELYVYREMTFEMNFTGQRPEFCSHSLKKYRLLSLFCGIGGLTTAFVNTGACESALGLDIDEVANNPFDWEGKGKDPSYRAYSIETFQLNYPDSLVYWGDLKSINNLYVPKCDIALISAPCVEYSLLGGRIEGLLEHFVPHMVRVLRQAGVRAIFIENVPQYFNSDTYHSFVSLLQMDFPYVYHQKIDSYDYGSIDHRIRGYSVLLSDKSEFSFPEPIKTPTSRRKRLKDYLSSTKDRTWIDIEGSTMGYFYNQHHQQYSETGFTAAKNKKLLVTENAVEIACITKGYGKIQSNQSYLLDKDQKRFSKFTPQEILNILGYPGWFKFVDGCSNTRQYELLGNSVNVRPIEAIASRVVTALMEIDIRHQSKSSFKVKETSVYEVNADGQIAFVIN
ncbi:DNA cytosine methyltransferase [Paenibacillus tundrae]|uniref:DNA cytosine methyltransferase n=1 Tax=Paenibacillus tundrae TaxID=528187 RepID=UPI0022A95634|nr:DNA cytosine methyltransferase [Paenibacillus tundrae]MCZ1268327.1 hypothetical protein [Paenibacillus tundrae]